jgi:hypothetical protein
MELHKIENFLRPLLLLNSGNSSGDGTGSGSGYDSGDGISSHVNKR